MDKAHLFAGGVEAVAQSSPEGRPIAIDAYVEGAVKAVLQLRASAPHADEVVVSGRGAADADLLARLRAALRGLTVHHLEGFALVAKQGAQGAAILADGLVGGRHEALVRCLRIREAGGTVLDHLHVITPAAARRRLGLEADG